MIRLVLLIYPAEFRNRYGAEITDVVTSSAQPIRDLANVAAHAARMRLEKIMTKRLRHAANAALLASVFLFGYTTNDLRGGITELHRHWWSTSAALLVALAATARVAVELVATRRRERPTS